MILRRHLPPAYSPVPWKAFSAAIPAALSAGPQTRDEAWVRALFSEQYGARASLLLDSGTSALARAIEACRDRPGWPRVALPAYGCYDLATAALGAGCVPVLYDVAPGNLGPETASLKSTVESGVAAVVVAHLYGFPVDMAAVRELTDVSETIVIEDAAQGIGATFRGKPLGSLGDLSILSFGRGKGWSGGGGGALLVRTDRLDPDRLDASAGAGAKNLVISLGAKLLGSPRMYSIPSSISMLRLGETVYREPHPPGALTRSSLATIRRSRDASLAEAQKRVENTREILGGDRARESLIPTWSADAAPGFLRLPCLVPTGAGMPTDAVRLGIIPGYPRPLSDLPVMGTAVATGPLAGATTLARDLVTVPTHSLLSPADIETLRGILDRWAAAGTT